MALRVSAGILVALLFAGAASAATFTVTNTNDSGAGSLRQAILDANANPGADTITFAIGSGPQLIPVSSLLPAVTDPAIIDGRTQPGYAGTPLIGIDGSLLNTTSYGSHPSGIEVKASSSTVYALSITNFHSSDVTTFQGSAGVTCEGTACVVKKCWLGIALDGKTVGGNDHNVELAGIGAIIGGPGEGNVMAGGYVGVSNVFLYAPATSGNTIQNNIIGLDPTGVTRKDNIYGVAIYAPNATIQNNTIAGNTYGDVFLVGSNFLFRGNKVGVNAFGTVVPSSSVTAAIVVSNGLGNVSKGTIGGPNPGDGNEICGGTPGIAIQDSGPTVIQGNTIHDNQSNGVYIYSGAAIQILDNTIYRNYAGVIVTSGAGNPILRNSIHDNFIGIQLSDHFPLLNDPGDLDVGGNLGQNYPVITKAVSAGAVTTITGTLNSTSNQTFHLEFFGNPQCDSSGYGEGRTYLGSGDVTTNGSGDGSFNISLNKAVPPGSVVTATATDPGSNTSEFSACAPVLGPGVLAFVSSSFSVPETAGMAAIPVARSGGTIGSVSVTYTTTGGTATAGADFTPASGTLIFADGQNVGYINVPILDDSIYEGPEQFTVTLTGAGGGAALGSPSIVNVGIVDDETPPVPTLSVNDISVPEGTGGDKQVSFTISLSHPVTSVVEVWTELKGLTAQFGSDFDGTVFNFVQFSPGETTKQIPVTIHGDSNVENNETFTLTIVNTAYFGAPPAPVIAKATGTCTIVNDDYGMQWVKVPVGSSARMNIQLGGPTTTGDTVTVSSAKPDIAAVPSSFTYDPGRTSLGFDVQGVSVGQSLISAKLPVSLGSTTLTAYAQVYKPVTLTTQPDSLTIPVNTTAPVTVTMSPAPTAPLTLKLTSSATSIQVPANVTIGTNGHGSVTVTGIALGSGNFTITLPDENGAFDTNVGFRVVDAPTTVFVTQIAPSSGPASGGTAATITGLNFVAPCNVAFGGIPAGNVSLGGVTSLSVTTPAHISGSVDVAVTCASNTYTLPNAFTYVASQPHLSSVFPTFGSVAGGTTVSIAGTDLRSSCGVFFDGAPAKIINDLTPDTLVAVTPPHAAGPVAVSIQCDDAPASLPSAFTYLTSGDPSAVIGDVNPLAAPPGQEVTITGIRFGPSDIITFGDLHAVVKGTTPMSHVAIVPAVAPGRVAVTLTDPEGHQSTTGPIFTVLEPVTPEISSATPHRIAPGAEMVITGKGFRAPYTFALGDKNAGTILDLSFNRAVVRIDHSFAAGSYTLGVLNAAGNLAAIGPQIDVAAALTASSASPMCSVAEGGSDVTITGSGFQPGAQVTFGDNPAPNVRVVDDHTILATVPAGKIGWPTITITNPNGDATTLTRGFFYYSPYDKDGGCASTRTRGVHH